MDLAEKLVSAASGVLVALIGFVWSSLAMCGAAVIQLMQRGTDVPFIAGAMLGGAGIAMICSVIALVHYTSKVCGVLIVMTTCETSVPRKLSKHQPCP